MSLNSTGLCRRVSVLEKHGKRKDVLTFFNVASEREIINRYPCLGETLAHDIILKRRLGPLKHLKDVWHLDRIELQLLADTSVVADDSIEPTEIITERPPSLPHPLQQQQEVPRPQSSTALVVNLRKYSLPVSPNLSAVHPTPPVYSSTYFEPPPSACPPPPLHSPVDAAIVELLDVLHQTEVVSAWRRYLRNTDNLTTCDTLGSSSTDYRLATWNLDKFTLTKAKHPGYREAICLAIVRNQIDIIALQEVVDPEAIQCLVDEMNRPTLPMLRRLHGGEESNPTKKAPVWAGVSSQERTGRTFQSNEYASFIYRSDRVKMRSQRILTTQQNTFARSPFMAKFQLGSNSVLVTSVHLKAAGLQGSHKNRTTDEIVALADFADALADTSQTFDILRSRGLSNVIQSCQATMATAIERSPTGQGDRTASCYDNAWLCRALSSPATASSSSTSDSAAGPLHFSGLGAVVSCDLRHPLIPSGGGAGFNGLPSDHCPIYFDLSTRPISAISPATLPLLDSADLSSSSSSSSASSHSN